jgi:hypothetical protein
VPISSPPSPLHSPFSPLQITPQGCPDFSPEPAGTSGSLRRFRRVPGTRTPSLTPCSVSPPGAHPHDLTLPIDPENHRRLDQQELTSTRRSSSRHPAPFLEVIDDVDHAPGFPSPHRSSSTSPSLSEAPGHHRRRLPVCPRRIPRRNPSLPVRNLPLTHLVRRISHQRTKTNHLTEQVPSDLVRSYSFRSDGSQSGSTRTGIG